VRVKESGQDGAHRRLTESAIFSFFTLAKVTWQLNWKVLIKLHISGLCPFGTYFILQSLVTERKDKERD
jgi:hypothetical protein